MTDTAPHRPEHPVDRSARLYRSLLFVYPRSFRDEYGDDMVQNFRDLLVFSADRRGVWWRTTTDLVTSSVKQRLASFGRGPGPSIAFALVVLVGLAGLTLLGAGGPGGAVFAVPFMVLVGLPVFGLTRFRRAWLVRRTTGGAVAGQLALGLASFVPAVTFVAIFGEEAGYWIFVSVALTLIVGSALGISWALITLFTADRSSGPRRRWLRPVLVLVPAVLILGAIIGGSYNSYRQSLGPPGDHSVENASPDTRALWEASFAGDLAEVVRITEETCADPWVKFPLGDGRHNAKGMAEELSLHGGTDHLPLGEIADHLGDYMDVWYDDCVLDRE